MIRKRAKEIHDRFSSLSKSECIATLHAVEGLMRWLERERPQRILEAGAGIGTLTSAALSVIGEDQEYVAIEPKAFCRRLLNENLGSLRSRLRVVESLTEVAEEERRFDFVIIDGGRKDVDLIVQSIVPGATVFVEGDRAFEQDKIKSWIGEDRLSSAYVRSNRRTPHGWMMGYTIYKVDPGTTARIRLGAYRLGSKAKLLARRFSFV